MVEAGKNKVCSAPTPIADCCSKPFLVNTALFQFSGMEGTNFKMGRVDKAKLESATFLSVNNAPTFHTCWQQVD
eukprot:4776854-Amphidinium_carterae.1